MIDAVTQTRLQDLFRRENRSFLQYVSQATPWCRELDRPIVEKVNHLAREELGALEKLADWMDSEHVPLPYLGAFSTSFTSFNFVDIRKLLAPLVVEQRKELADLEADAKCLDQSKAKALINELVELNRKQLEMMESLKKPLAA